MFPFFSAKREGGAGAGADDRRREERVEATGEVVLVLETPHLLEVRGRLLDRSASGFRAAHMYPALTSGQAIRCRVEGKELMARVVWNRIIEEEVETGFLLL